MSALFKCEACGGTFYANRSDEEAMADYLAAGHAPEPAPAEVCSRCYDKIMAAMEQDEVLTTVERERWRANQTAKVKSSLRLGESLRRNAKRFFTSIGFHRVK